MSKYRITKPAFLGSWTVTSPPVLMDFGAGAEHVSEGKTLATHAEAVAWMNEHAAMQWLQFYYAHTAAEPVIP